MSASRTDIRRVTIVLGGGETDAQALTMLSSVLAELGSEVTGLFLEDAELFQLAELPWAQEICRLTSRARPLRTTELQRQVRVQAGRAERAVQLSAERAGLKWSFRTMRGRLNVALQASQDVELLLLSAAKRMMGAAAEAQTLSRARAFPGQVRARPIVTVFDGSAAAERALRTAARLASSTQRQLLVLGPAQPPEGLVDLVARVGELIENGFSVLPLPSAEIDVLARSLRARSAALCVLPADQALLEEGTLGRLRQLAECPVLIVR